MKILLLTAMALAPQFAVPTHTGAPSTSGGGTITYSNTCSAATSSCTLPTNVASGDVLVVIASSSIYNGGTGISAVSGCGATWTLDPSYEDSTMATGLSPTSGSCTITVTSPGGGFPFLCAADISGSAGIDVRGAIAFAGSSPKTAPSVTTTVANDLVVAAFIDVNVDDGTYTAGAGYTEIVSGGYGCAIEATTAATTGAYTPTIAYSLSSDTVGAASLALKP